MEQSNENEGPVLAAPPEHIIHAICRLGTLGPEQRQMLDDGNILSLLEQFAATRRLYDSMLDLAALVFGGQFVFGLPAGELNWISGVIAAACWLFCRSRKRMITEVTRLVYEFTDTEYDDKTTTESQILIELRLHHSLTQQQSQRIRSGETIAVATEIAASDRRIGWLIMLATVGLLALCAAMMGDVLMDLLSTTQASRTSALLAVLLVALIFGSPIWQITNAFKKARKLERLAGIHSVEMAALAAGSGTATDANSPYRSPQFR